MRKCWNCGEPTEDNDLRVCTDPICGSAALKMRSRHEKREADRKALEALRFEKRLRAEVEKVKVRERKAARKAKSALEVAKAAEKRAKDALEKLKAYEADAWMEQAEIDTARQTNSMPYLTLDEKKYLKQLRKLIMNIDSVAECPQCGELSTYHRHGSSIEPRSIGGGKLQWVVELYCKCVRCMYTWKASVLPEDLVT